MADEQRVGLVLRDLFAAAALADVDHLGPGAHEVERLGRDQLVVEHDIRLRQRLGSAPREQARVARAGADEDHASGHERSSRAPALSRRSATAVPSASGSSPSSSSRSHAEPSGAPTHATSRRDGWDVL